MAYHHDERGHTPVIVGREYVRYMRYSGESHRCKLIKHNPTTGYCVLRASFGLMFVSETDLSRWYMCPVGIT